MSILIQCSTILSIFGNDKKIENAIFTYPRSRSDFNCVLVNRLGSPLPSIATASNSSNGGATNKSRKFIGRYLFRFVPNGSCCCCCCICCWCWCCWWLIHCGWCCWLIITSLLYAPANGSGSTENQKRKKAENQKHENPKSTIDSTHWVEMSSNGREIVRQHL